MEQTSNSDNTVPILSVEDFYRLKQDFEARFACAPSAIKMSSLTQKLLTRDFNVLPSSEPYETLYGIPLITDESVPFNRFQLEFKRNDKK